MLNLADLLQKSNGDLCVYQDLVAEADEPLSDRLTIVIPDMHLLEKKETDDFWDNNPDHEQRFLRFLNFLVILRNSEGPDLEIIQIGDLYDLWQARGNTNLISAAYPDILGQLDLLSPFLCWAIMTLTWSSGTRAKPLGGNGDIFPPFRETPG